nr:hypothetical protein [Tanacetum cinerariifolium]
MEIKQQLALGRFMQAEIRKPSSPKASVIPIFQIHLGRVWVLMSLAPKVGAVYVTSPAEVLDLVDHSSSSDSDPSEDSLPLVPEVPLVSPFLCSDDSKVDNFTSDSSSSSSSSDSLLDTSSGSPSDLLSDTSSVHSLRFDASGQSHSGPSTRVASSRFPTTLVSSSTSISRSIAPTHADLLPPRKRFRDSYSPKDSREEHVETSTADAEAVADLGISDGVRAHTRDGIGMGVEIAASDIREDEEEFETTQR